MERRRKVVIAALALSTTIASLTASVTGEPDVAERIYTVDDVPEREVAIVLGCKPGPLLTQRMDAACALVKRGKSRKLMLTGLPEEMPYMKSRAEGCGAELLVDDGATRTLENLRRSRDLFGVRRAIVVTQRFHMSRALYLADALDVDAVGALAAGDPRSVFMRVRERVATAKARLDVALLDDD